MYTCQFCVANGKSPEELTFNSDLTWLTHLVSEQHFGVQRLLGAKKTFENWDLKRTIVVSGVLGLKAKEIVDFFATFGDVQDFFYVSKEDGKAQFCKVLMADEKSARSIHEIGLHKVKNTSFQVRLQLEAAVKISPIPPDKASSSESTSVASSVSSIGNSPKMPEKFKILYGKPEGEFTLADGFFCRTCEFKVGFGEERWVHHLISEQHQKIHRANQHLRKVLWDLDKTVMVSKAKGVSSAHILRYLVANGGAVLDFSYLAVKQGETDVCYALMSTKEEANKLTVSEKHCIGPQRVDVRISSITNDEKLKWRNWKSKLLSRIESKTEEKLKFDESFVMDDEDDVRIEEVNKPDAAVDISSKRKNIRSDSKIERSIETFKGLTISQQLEKFRDEFGWDANFLKNAIKFVDHIISKTNLKPKKVPFGDFTTGLGLRSSPTLQLLVDVQDILEAKTQNSQASITSMMNSCVRSLEALKAKNYKTFPIKQIRTAESEICVSSTIKRVETSVKLKFSNSLPFVECTLFKFYCDFDVRLFSMSFVLSFWASSNNYLQNTKQAYPNQLLIFLIMFYLQHKKVIPTIQKLQESNPEDTKPLLINGNNLAFCSDVDTISKIHPNPLADMLKNDDSIKGMSVLGLLKDFFQFFASADLKENALCTRFGYFIPKKDFQPDSVGKLPGDLCRVYRFGMSIAEHKQSDILTTKKFLCSQTPLCIQHPFDLSLNCSRAITPNEVLRFQNGCKNTIQVLVDLLTSDKPDFTMFLSKCVPVIEEISENSCKKIKTEPISITSITSVPTPKKVVPPVTAPIQSITPVPISTQPKIQTIAPVPISTQPKIQTITQVPISTQPKIQTITPVPISTHPNKLTSPPPPSVVAHLPVVSSSQPDIHNKPNVSTSPTKTNSPRVSAADFFDNKEPETGIINKPENEPLPMSFESDSTMRDCTIALNIHLFDYFARSFSGTDAMKFEKLQILMFQYILEFNQKFWVNCLGLIFEPKVGHKFWPEEFATIFNEGKSKTDKTILQKLLEIANIEQDLNVTFRVRSDGKLIHKMFVDLPDHNLTSKWCKGTFLTEFSLQLYEEVPDSRLTEIKNSVFAQCNSKSEEQQILLECQLLGAVSTDRNFPTPLVTLNIGAAKYGNERIVALKSLFRTLCMSYVNKMVKRWLAEAKDFNDNKANNFVKGRNQWTPKANIKTKNQMKQAAKKMQNANYVPMNNTPRPKFTNPNQQVYRQQFSQRNPQFQSPRLMPLGHGSGYTPQSSSYSGGRGQMTAPHPDQFQSNTRLPPQYQQQHKPMYNSVDPPPERLLRNPGPQGMRTFYPPHLQPSQPRSVPLLPNPQFDVSHDKPRFISNPCANQDMLNAPFQNQDYHSRPITLEVMSNSSHHSQLSDSPLDYYSDMSSSQSQSLFKNPSHQPQPLFLQNPHHLENPHFNYNPAHDENEKAHQDRFEKFVQRGLAIQTPSSPMFTRRDPLPDQIQRSPPKPKPLFESINVQQPQRYLEQREQRVPYQNQPRQFLEPIFPNKPRPLFEMSPPKSFFESSNHQYLPNPAAAANNSAQMYPGGFRQNPAVKRKQSEGSRPSQPMNRAFINGGVLSTERVDSEEEEMDIIWELDFKGNSSPSPPRKQYKVGAAFPVPSRPNLDRARSPLSAFSRDPREYPRQGEYTTTAPNSTRGLFVSADNFQGFGINPCGGITDSFFNQKRF